MGSNTLEQIALDGTVERIPLGLEGLQWMLMPASCNGHDPSVPCPVGAHLSSSLNFQQGLRFTRTILWVKYHLILTLE
ncbi:MAG UNVERIFIED_CONTAM: hypothetical protein LVT10_14275 [Anaerolineae bacterium]|jgi:hypothetical protein